MEHEGGTNAGSEIGRWNVAKGGRGGMWIHDVDVGGLFGQM